MLAGDFNNIESVTDKQVGSNKTSISSRELEAWNKLLLRLRVKDSYHLDNFHMKSPKIFTWTNSHTDGTRIQTQIDRIYIGEALKDVGGDTEILPTLPDISDHAGVLLHTHRTKKHKPQQPCFNKGLLLNPDSKAALLDIWKTVMNSDLETWNKKMVAANQAIRAKSDELTKAQRKKWKDAYLSQFEDIIAAEEELQHNWNSQEARDKLSDAQAVLHEVRQHKFQFQECAILSKWARVGDRCTKEFFEFHEGHRKPISISQLRGEGDRFITTQAELESHILTFYEQLYTRDDIVEADEAAREECFRTLQQTVTEEHNLELMRPLTLLEVSTTMKQLPAGKAPGVDAIPAEFYQALWDEIGNDIFSFVEESIQEAHIEAELNVSKITLLPKSEDRSRVQNFRPISLLNTLYKIVAKVYANRMKPLLHNWILPSQTGFVPNRCILDNIFLAFEAI